MNRSKTCFYLYSTHHVTLDRHDLSLSSPSVLVLHTHVCVQSSISLHMRWASKQTRCRSLFECMPVSLRSVMEAFGCSLQAAACLETICIYRRKTLDLYGYCRYSPHEPVSFEAKVTLVLISLCFSAHSCDVPLAVMLARHCNDYSAVCYSRDIMDYTRTFRLHPVYCPDLGPDSDNRGLLTLVLPSGSLTPPLARTSRVRLFGFSKSAESRPLAPLDSS